MNPTHDSATALFKEIEKYAVESLQADIKKFVDDATEKAIEQVKAKWIVQLNDLIKVCLVQMPERYGCEIRVCFLGWDKK